MKIDAGLMGGLEQVPAAIKELEAQGFDGAVTAEISGDPFLPLLLAAEHSERIELIAGEDVSEAVVDMREQTIDAAVARHPVFRQKMAVARRGGRRIEVLGELRPEHLGLFHEMLSRGPYGGHFSLLKFFYFQDFRGLFDALPPEVTRIFYFHSFIQNF